jgi:hypothetical protein
MVPVFAHEEIGLNFRSKTEKPPTALTPVTPSLSNLDYIKSPKGSINATPKGIQLHFRAYPLGEVLRNIHDEAGIRFKLAPQMKNNPIYVDIEAKNWEKSVKKLIVDFSRLEVWTNQLKTSRIWLMKSTPQD